MITNRSPFRNTKGVVRNALFTVNLIVKCDIFLPGLITELVLLNGHSVITTVLLVLVTNVLVIQDRLTG